MNEKNIPNQMQLHCLGCFCHCLMSLSSVVVLCCCCCQVVVEPKNEF